MLLHQLNPPLSLETTFGPATCHLVSAIGDDVFWCCFQDQTGECWWWPNHLVRLSPNVTEARVAISPIALPPALEAVIAPHRARYAKGK